MDHQGNNPWAAASLGSSPESFNPSNLKKELCCNQLNGWIFDNMDGLPDRTSVKVYVT